MGTVKFIKIRKKNMRLTRFVYNITNYSSFCYLELIKSIYLKFIVKQIIPEKRSLTSIPTVRRLTAAELSLCCAFVVDIRSYILSLFVVISLSIADEMALDAHERKYSYRAYWPQLPNDVLILTSAQSYYYIKWKNLIITKIHTFL